MGASVHRSEIFKNEILSLTEFCFCVILHSLLFAHCSFQFGISKVIPFYSILFLTATVFPCRQNVTVTCDVFMERTNAGGVFIAARVNKGGQSVRNAAGVFFWVFADGTYKVSNDLGQWPHSLI